MICRNRGTRKYEQPPSRAKPNINPEDKRHVRRAALNSWKALAEKKVANQDTYYKAIQSDVEAVRDRLRSFRKTKEPDEVERFEDVCNRPWVLRNIDSTPSRMCAGHAGRNRGSQGTAEQRNAANKLTDRLLESTKNLLEGAGPMKSSYRRSTASVRRRQFGLGHRNLRKHLTGQTSGPCMSKAKKKITSLSKAVITSKETQRALNESWAT